MKVGKTLAAYLIHARCWTLIKRMIGSRAEKELEKLVLALKVKFHNYSFGLDGYNVYLSECATRRQDCTKKWAVMRDPAISIRVRDILKTAVQRRSAHMTRGRQRSGYQTPAGVNGLRVCIPVEIQYMIFEYAKVQDAFNALEAFNWPVLDSYWIERTPTDLVFELQEVPSDQLDWAYVCAKIADLLELTSDLVNRQRTIGILREIKKIF